jgi:integrase
MKQTRSRASSGGVIERMTSSGIAYAIRFRADVERDGLRVRERFYVNLPDVATRSEAEQRLADTLTLVPMGRWSPPERAPVVEVPRDEPTFHEYASEWFVQRQAEGLAAKTIADLRGSLVNHLLPFFQHHRLSEITVQEVDRYKISKSLERQELEARLASWVNEDSEKRGPRPPRPLSNSSINHTLRHLAQILEVAVDQGLITSNPATGRRRRLKPEAPSRPWVEPQQLPAFLSAAKTSEGKIGVGYVLLALLCGTGLRIDEALSLTWRDVDLGTGHIYVTRSKTPKGVRRIPLSPALRETLTLWKTDTRHNGDGDYLIATGTGARANPSNLRRDVLAKAIAAADVELARLGIRPIGHVTFHGLRRTFASLRSYLGKPIRQTADVLGHEDVRFTLNAYAQSSLDPDEMLPSVRSAFLEGLEWARTGAYRALTGTDILEPEIMSPAQQTKSPVSGALKSG